MSQDHGTAAEEIVALVTMRRQGTNYRVPHNYLDLNFEISPSIVIKSLVASETSGK
jgi:hypothetical protein